ncbi:MAG: efflux transporter outer membrane subunit, partial [Pseudomonas sp.]
MKSHARFINRQMFKTTFGAVSAVAFLTACTVGPDYQIPPPSLSQHYDQQAEQRLGQGGNKPGEQRIDLGKKVNGDWWSAFRSPKLD